MRAAQTRRHSGGLGQNGGNDHPGRRAERHALVPRTGHTQSSESLLEEEDAGAQAPDGEDSEEQTRTCDHGIVPKAAPGLSKDPTPTLERRTTILMKNLPHSFTREELTRTLDDSGLAGCYNFVYVPRSFRTMACMCYAFINMCSPELALRCFDVFQGFKNWSVESDNICEVVWCDKFQGLEQHVKRYRNSPLMHPKVPEKFKPMLYEGGIRVPFPPPTQALKQPRMRKRESEDGDLDAVI